MFKLELNFEDGADLLRVGFNDQPSSHTNQELTAFVYEHLNFLPQPIGGRLLKVNGACSIPISWVLAKNFLGVYQTVAIYDPKLTGYVVVSSTEYKIGDVIK